MGRTSSLSAAFTIPFRRNTPEHDNRRRSQMSISKWFGGAGSDSSDEENEAMRSGASTAEGEDTPVFSLTEPPEETGLAVDDSDEDEVDGVIPTPGGAPVGLTPVMSGGAAAAQYSPPQQDKE